MAQIAYHVSTGQDFWEYKVYQGMLLYLALEDKEKRIDENAALELVGRKQPD